MGHMPVDLGPGPDIYDDRESPDPEYETPTSHYCPKCDSRCTVTHFDGLPPSTSEAWCSECQWVGGLDEANEEEDEDS